MTFVETWDTGLHGATWDSGLQWDVNVGPAPGDVTPYLNLITSEHRDKPKFIHTVTTLLQPLCDLQVTLLAMRTLFDLDTAAGVQLDDVGRWIGASRNLTVPLPNSWFTWSTTDIGLGWNQGSWRNPADPNNEVITLPDDAFRTLLRARAANNQWDGTIPGAYAIWDVFFSGTGYTIDITDNQNMTMVFTLRGPTPDALTMAMLDSGLLSMVPAGVSATYGYTP